MGYDGPPPASSNNRTSRSGNSLETLLKVYDDCLDYDESSSNLVDAARSSLNAIKGSKFNTDSIQSLVRSYAESSNDSESALDLRDATCETIKTLRYGKRSVEDAVSLIET
jgi:predicted transcriptional regulator